MSDPCQGQDCSRPDCLLCETKLYSGKNTSQDCSERNLGYQTFCISCQERDEARIKEENQDEKKAADKIKNMRKHIYIGETSRSTYERSEEHRNDMRQLNSTSHLLSMRWISMRVRSCVK